MNPTSERCSPFVFFDDHYWLTGRNGKVEFNFPTSVTEWTIVIGFDKDVTGLEFWNGHVTKLSSKSFQVTNKGHNAIHEVGDQVSLGFQVEFEADVGFPDVVSLSINGSPLCGGEFLSFDFLKTKTTTLIIP